MPAYTATMPIDIVPQWPPLCVRCRADDPDSTYSFRAGRVGLDQIFTLTWAIGSRPRVHAPACTACAAALRRQRIIRACLSWVVIVPLSIVVYFTLKWLGAFHGPLHPFRRWIAVGAMAVALVPYFVWEELRPPAIDATAKGKKLAYEFADKYYAHAFGNLNDDHLL